MKQGIGSSSFPRTRNVVSEKLVDWLTKESFWYCYIPRLMLLYCTQQCQAKYSIKEERGEKDIRQHAGEYCLIVKKTIVTWVANNYSGNFHLKLKTLQVIQTRQSFTCVEFFNSQLNTDLTKVVYMLLKINPFFVAVIHVVEGWLVYIAHPVNCGCSK